LYFFFLSASVDVKLPSTTLSTIDVKIGELNVIDTPGIVCENSIIVYIEDGEYYKAYGGTDGTYIDGGEQKLFAIYCEQ